MFKSLAEITLVIGVVFLLSYSSVAQTKKSVATKYYEFTWGTGNTYSGFYSAQLSDIDKVKELRTRVSRYIRLTRLRRVRPYIIIYESRVKSGSIYSSVFSRRKAEIKKIFEDFRYNTERITFVNGGYSWAHTELWVVPKKAEPPQPKPILGKDSEVRCPNTYISSSPRIPKPGDLLKFRIVNLNREIAIKSKFKWKVEGGEIIAGDGANEIRVKPSENGKNVIARVFLEGAPLNCPAKDIVKTSIIGLEDKHVLVDEFSIITNGDLKARLDNFAYELRENPRLDGTIRCYQGRNERKRRIIRQLKLIKDYLINARGIGSARVSIDKVGYREKFLCRLWLSSKDTNEDPPNYSSVDKKYVRYP